MKNLVILIMLTTMVSFADAQESWRIVLHKKTILSATVSDEEKNVALLKSADWKKNGFLELEYKKADPANTWIHSFQFVDEQGRILLTRDSSTTAKVSTKELRKLFAGKKQIRISLLISPPNRMILAPSRNIHLATLKLP